MELDENDASIEIFKGLREFKLGDIMDNDWVTLDPMEAYYMVGLLELIHLCQKLEARLPGSMIESMENNFGPLEFDKPSMEVYNSYDNDL